MAACAFQDCCCLCPRLWGRPLSAQASTGNPPTFRGRAGSVSCGLSASFSWILVHTRFYLCPLRVSVSPSSMEILQSNPTGLQGQIPWGFPVPLLDPQAGKPDVGVRIFTIGGELLWYYCSPVCGSPTWQVYGIWFYHDCAPPTILLRLLLCLWIGGIFFSRSQHPPDNGCSTANCGFGALAPK